jgi:hypothetical protein
MVNLNPQIEQNQKRILEQEKIYNYYIGDKDAILGYLNEVQEITFDSDTIRDFQKVFINITKKVINKLANVYKKPADRYFVNSDGAYNEDLTNMYNSFLPDNINSIDKQALRFAKGLNTSLTYVGFKDKIIYKVLPSHLREAASNEPLIFNKQWYFYTQFEPETILQDNLDQIVVDCYHAGRPVEEFFNKLIKR